MASKGYKYPPTRDNKCHYPKTGKRKNKKTYKMEVIETGRGNATVMNTYMENKEIIGSQDIKTYRLQMVQDALKYGIKPWARHYQTTVKNST